MSAQRPQDQYVKVGNINTRFWAAGDKGTAVILIHGLGGSVEMWEHNINALAQNHRVYAMDLVGFGRSDKLPALMTPSHWAQFVSDFMAMQHIDKASLVGASMGGLVSLQFAIKFPDRVDKLVLVDSAGLGRETALMLRLVSLPLIGELLMRPSRKGAAQIFKNCVYDPSLITDEMAEEIYPMMSLPGAQKCLLSAVHALGNFRGQSAHITRFIGDNLPKITAPTLIIWGKQDRILPVAHAHVAAEKIPNSKLQLFDRCGHTPAMEHPEEFNKLVLEFLAG